MPSLILGGPVSWWVRIPDLGLETLLYSSIPVYKSSGLLRNLMMDGWMMSLCTTSSDV